MKPNRGEFAALVATLTFTMMIPVLYQQHAEIYPIDYRVYMDTATGQGAFFYPDWIKFILLPFALLPFWFGFVLWNVLNIGCLYAACKLWGGNTTVALLSYPMLFALFYGQITGILVLCLVLYHRWIAARPSAAGLVAAIALAKPQLAVPILLYSALRQSVTWHNRLVSTLPTLALFALSLLIYGDWVTGWLTRLPTAASEGSITMWTFLGHWALLLWLPLGFIERERRLGFVICTTALSLPYFQLTGLLLLLAYLPFSLLSILAFIGYLMIVWGWFGASLMLLLPLSIYIWTLTHHARSA